MGYNIHKPFFLNRFITNVTLDLLISTNSSNLCYNTNCCKLLSKFVYAVINYIYNCTHMFIFPTGNACCQLFQSFVFVFFVVESKFFISSYYCLASDGIWHLFESFHPVHDVTTMKKERINERSFSSEIIQAIITELASFYIEDVATVPSICTTSFSTRLVLKLKVSHPPINITLHTEKFNIWCEIFCMSFFFVSRLIILPKENQIWPFLLDINFFFTRMK